MLRPYKRPSRQLACEFVGLYRTKKTGTLAKERARSYLPQYFVDSYFFGRDSGGTMPLMR
jgi:hypothetical protein